MKLYQSASSASPKGGVAAPHSGRGKREGERSCAYKRCHVVQEGVVDVQGARGGDRLQMWGRVERTPRWQMSEQACGGKAGVLEEINNA